MTFDELLNSVREGRDVVIPASWGQGRATFGGLVAALAFDVMASKVAPGRAMRAMQVSFVGPVEPDVPAVFEAELLREGKAVSQVQGRILQNGETRLACLASFGGDRESSVQVAPSPAPEAVPVDQCQELPYIPGVTPEFTQHIDMRWSFGNMPFSGKGGREMGGLDAVPGDALGPDRRAHCGVGGCLATSIITAFEGARTGQFPELGVGDCASAADHEAGRVAALQGHD